MNKKAEDKKETAIVIIITVIMILLIPSMISTSSDFDNVPMGIIFITEGVMTLGAGLITFPMLAKLMSKENEKETYWRIFWARIAFLILFDFLVSKSIAMFDSIIIIFGTFIIQEIFKYKKEQETKNNIEQIPVEDSVSQSNLNEENQINSTNTHLEEEIKNKRRKDVKIINTFIIVGGIIMVMVIYHCSAPLRERMKEPVREINNNRTNNKTQQKTQTPSTIEEGNCKYNFKVDTTNMVGINQMSIRDGSKRYILDNVDDDYRELMNYMKKFDEVVLEMCYSDEPVPDNIEMESYARESKMIDKFEYKIQSTGEIIEARTINDINPYLEKMGYFSFGEKAIIGIQESRYQTISTIDEIEYYILHLNIRLESGQRITALYSVPRGYPGLLKETLDKIPQKEKYQLIVEVKPDTEKNTGKFIFEVKEIEKIG